MNSGEFSFPSLLRLCFEGFVAFNFVSQNVSVENWASGYTFNFTAPVVDLALQEQALLSPVCT